MDTSQAARVKLASIRFSPDGYHDSGKRLRFFKFLFGVVQLEC